MFIPTEERVMISVTNVAILIGDNKWNSPIECIFDLIDQPFYDDKQPLSPSFNKKREEYKKNNKMLDENININRFINNNIDKSKTVSDQKKEAKEIIDKIYENKKDDIEVEKKPRGRPKKVPQESKVIGIKAEPTIDKDILLNNVTNQITMNSGVVNERLIFDNIDMGKVFTECKVLRLDKREIIESPEFIINDTLRYNIIGVTDGIIETDMHGLCILEIKYRQNMLYYTFPAFEKDQVQLYMHFLKYKRAIFVQNYEDKYGIYVVDYDEEYVKAIFKKLDAVLLLIQKKSQSEEITYDMFEKIIRKSSSKWKMSQPKKKV